MNAKKLALTMLLCASGLFGTAQASESCKIGYVSLDRLIAESAPAKKARATLDKDFKSREHALDKSAAKLREAQQKYEKEFPNLSDDQRTARESAITKDIERFESERTSFETELADAQNALLQDLLKKADEVVFKMAQNLGLDAVVREAVFIRPECDLTQRVIQQLK